MVMDYVYDIYKTEILFPFSENCVSRIHACRLTVITPRLFKIIPITYTFLETRFNSLCNEPLILLLYYDLKNCQLLQHCIATLLLEQLIHNDIAWVYIRVTIKAFGLLQQAISPAKRVVLLGFLDSIFSLAFLPQNGSFMFGDLAIFSP